MNEFHVTCHHNETLTALELNVDSIHDIPGLAVLFAGELSGKTRGSAEVSADGGDKLLR